MHHFAHARARIPIGIVAGAMLVEAINRVSFQYIIAYTIAYNSNNIHTGRQRQSATYNVCVRVLLYYAAVVTLIP